MVVRNNKFTRENLAKGMGDGTLMIAEPGIIAKEYKQRDRYNIEKICYLRLKNERHFPKIIDWDDNTLTIKMTYAGRPLKITDNVKNYKKQINEIITSLKSNNIEHGDIHFGNILILNGILYMIDFEWARDLSTPPEWKPIPNRNKIPSIINLPKPNKDPKLRNYIENNIPIFKYQLNTWKN